LTLLADPAYVLTTKTKGTATIVDDELPVVTIKASDTTASEPGTDTGRFTITRVGDKKFALSVNLTIAGSASNGADYVLINETLVIPPNLATAVINVTPLDDPQFEGPEVVSFTIAQGVGYVVGTPEASSISIVDDENVLSLVATDAKASEAGIDIGAFTISRTGSTTSELIVKISVTGSATNGVDFEGITSPIMLGIGERSKIIFVNPLQDDVVENNETATLTILPDFNYVAHPSKYKATATIIDDERPKVSIAATPSTLLENSGLPFVVTISRTGNTQEALTIPLGVAGTATKGIDYDGLPDNVTIPAAANNTKFNIVINNDAQGEANETVVIALMGGPNYILGATTSKTLTITNDDAQNDVTPPTIANRLPVNGAFLKVLQPTIAADFADAESGISVVASTVTLNGQPVNLTATGFSHIPPAPLAQGLHTVAVHLADNAGNATDSTWTFTIDSVPPVITPDKFEFTQNQKPNITATWTDTVSGIDLNTRVIKLDEAVVDVQLTPTGFTYTPPTLLHNGVHTVEVTIADRAGNSSTEYWSFFVDTVPPQIQNAAVSPTSPTNDKRPIFTWSYVDPAPGSGINAASPTVFLGANNVTNDVARLAQGYMYRPAQELADGVYILKISVSDKAGNVGQDVIVVTIDSAEYGEGDPPSIITFAPQEPLWTEDTANGLEYYFHSTNSITFTGTVSGGITPLTAKINGQIAGGNGNNFSATLNLSEGVNAVEFQVSDAANQTVAKIVRVFIDNSAPFISVIDASPATRNDQSGLLFTHPLDGQPHHDGYHSFQYGRKLLVNKICRPSFAVKFVAEDAYSTIDPLGAKVQIFQRYVNNPAREFVPVAHFPQENNHKKVEFTAEAILDGLPDGDYTISLVAKDKLNRQTEVKSVFSFDVGIDTQVATGSDLYTGK
jgi:hypothetical protein